MRTSSRGALPRVGKLVSEYFRLLRQREYAKARGLLEERIRKSKSEWDDGYYAALRGMLAAYEGDSRGYTFIKNIDENELREICDEFRELAMNSLLRPFDRGFFTAWLHYTRVLHRAHVDK